MERSLTSKLLKINGYLSYMFCIFCICINIMKTRLFKYTENFTTKKCKFSDKNSDIFHIFAQNLDCGYSL